MGKLIGCFFIFFYLLLSLPQEAAAQDFFPRLFRSGKYVRYSCRKMEAYNQRSAYNKHKKGFFRKLIAGRPRKNNTPETVARNKQSSPAPGKKETNTGITSTSRTKLPASTPPATKPPVSKPGPGNRSLPDNNKVPPIAKVAPKEPKNADTVLLAKKDLPKLTREALKRMTIEERRDTLEKTTPTIVLPPIQFISDQDEFSVVNMDSFMQAMEYAQQGKVVLIEGHTDDLGSEIYNLKLSMKRAEKIRQLLLSGDVSDELISVIGYGEGQPVVPNTSDENRAINRRIEFKIFSISN